MCGRYAIGAGFVMPVGPLRVLKKLQDFAVRGYLRWHLSAAMRVKSTMLLNKNKHATMPAVTSIQIGSRVCQGINHSNAGAVLKSAMLMLGHVPATVGFAQ